MDYAKQRFALIDILYNTKQDLAAAQREIARLEHEVDDARAALAAARKRLENA